jgi:sarcosine oxidase subunit alpha
MINTDILVVGGGPAGLCAALTAKKAGSDVMLIDRSPSLGGQLIKQTHKFFGSKEHHASVRGFEIAKMLIGECFESGIEIMGNATALGFYGAEGIVAIEKDEKIIKVKPKRTIIATGAGEKFLAFKNNDLPGIYGAGAVQTLMNEYGVRPGKNVLMVGAGNIGLIVSYQLLQAGVNIKAVIEGGPNIGGYLVHAAKLRRAGIPIYTSHTIKEAYGTNWVEGATIAALDSNWNLVPGSEKTVDVDVICIAVGLTPLTDLLWQAGCQLKYVGELGGHVPLRNNNLETSVEGIYVAGDSCGVEEATAAMLEGKIAGINAAESLGDKSRESAEEKVSYWNQLQMLREGPAGEKIRNGLAKVAL